MPNFQVDNHETNGLIKTNAKCHCSFYYTNSIKTIEIYFLRIFRTTLKQKLEAMYHIPQENFRKIFVSFIHSQNISCVLRILLRK